MTSYATLSNLPNIPLTAPKKKRLAYLSEHLKDRDLKRYSPKYLILNSVEFIVQINDWMDC